MVLGLVLRNPERAIDRLQKIAGILSAEDFFLRSHGVVFIALGELGRMGQPIDLINLVACLESSGTLEAAGGIACVSTLGDNVPAVADIAFHAWAVHRRAVLRRAAREVNSIAQAAVEAGADPNDIAARLRSIADTLDSIPPLLETEK